MFRWTIRELLLLTALVAVCVGWWRDNHWEERARTLEALLEANGFVVNWEERYVLVRFPRDEFQEDKSFWSGGGQIWCYRAR